MADGFLGRFMLEEFLCFPDTVQCLAPLAELASTKAQAATAQGSWMAAFAARSIAIQCSTSERALAQSPLRRWSMLAAK